MITPSWLSELNSPISVHLNGIHTFQSTEELYKKDVHDPDNHYDVITHHKASGGDGIPAELFQILKDDAVKVLHSTCQKVWKTQLRPQDWTMSVFIPIRKESNAK